jgi:Helix-turn-helix domain
VRARRRWSVDQVRALGVTTDVVTAGQILGTGRTTAYRLAREGTFPVPLIIIGSRYQVPVASLLATIRVTD